MVWGRHLLGYWCALFCFMGIEASARVNQTKSCATVVADGVTEAKFSAEDPLSFLRYQDVTASMGSMMTAYLPEYQTRFYFPLSAPTPEGTLPLVRPDASAITVYFHGSGTQRASGKNFIQKMQSLYNAGASPLAFDLPFHSEGPTGGAFLNLDYFMQWLHSIVLKLKSFKKPIYFVGHSFGPFVIQEYIARYPDDVAGAVMISAAGNYHPALTWTYENITDPGMPFIDATLKEYAANEAGGRWAYEVEKQATWTKRPAPPTKLIYVRGTNDEWFPENTWLPQRLGVKQPYQPREVEEWLREKFPKAEFIFADGVGHYIFEAKTSTGKDLILETMFDLMQVEPEKRFSPIPPNHSASERLAALYYTNPLFREWAGDKFKHMVRTEERAELTLIGWRTANIKVWREIFAELPSRFPEFFRERYISWEKLTPDVYRNNAFGHEKEWDEPMKQFQIEFFRYLEALKRGETIELGPDPLKPGPAAIDPKLFNAGEVGRRGVTGPIYWQAFEATLRGRGTILKTEFLDNYRLVRVSYSITGSDTVFQALLLASQDPAEAEAWIQEAFMSARRKAQWKLPNEKWEGEARGVRFKGVHQAGKILNCEVLGPTDPGAYESQVKSDAA